VLHNSTYFLVEKKFPENALLGSNYANSDNQIHCGHALRIPFQKYVYFCVPPVVEYIHRCKNIYLLSRATNNYNNKNEIRTV